MEKIKETFVADALYMLKYFPLLLPSKNFRHWEGIISVMGAEILLIIDCPYYPSIKDIEIKGPSGFQQALNNILNQVQHTHHTCLIDVLKTIKLINVLPIMSLNDDTDKECSKIKDTSWFNRYDKVLKELKYIGTNNVLKTDGTLTQVSLRKEDDFGYQHTLDLKLLDNYPSIKPILENVDLPDVVLSEFTLCNDIIEIFSKFCSLISALQNFWQVYGELRRRSWVIDPEYPKKRDTYCRIIVGDNVSVLVSLNPLEVMSFPDIKFLGADKSIAPFRKTLENNLKELGWDMNNNLIDNLLAVLGLEEFPLRPSVHDSQRKLGQLNQNDDMLVTDQECCICFMMRTDDCILPTKICNNNKCTSVVHISCLAQWFQSIPTNEPSFNLISGDCPHCGKRILCPVNAI